VKLICGSVIILFFVFTAGWAGSEPQGPHHGYMAGGQENVSQEPGICPVMKLPAQADHSYTYEGRTYYFCCPSCIEKFKADPEKYASRIKTFDIEAYRYGYEPEIITVKKGDIVKMEASSRDVPHGIYIKEYNINRRLEKGETALIEFVAAKEGTFDIRCSVYCGTGHQAMKAKLIVQ